MAKISLKTESSINNLYILLTKILFNSNNVFVSQLLKEHK